MSQTIPCFVIGMRRAQVGHCFAAHGQVDFGNRARVARFSLLNFDNLSYSPPLPLRALARLPMRSYWIKDSITRGAAAFNLERKLLYLMVGAARTGGQESLERWQ